MESQNVAVSLPVVVVVVFAEVVALFFNFGI
jgi:hypothetical protein